jgi:glycine hydroxymethyltransferase
MIPFDKRKPLDPSGIRIGTPVLTTRGMKEDEMRIVGELMAKVIDHKNEEEKLKEVQAKVSELCKRFPIYQNLKYD